MKTNKFLIVAYTTSFIIKAKLTMTASIFCLRSLLTFSTIDDSIASPLVGNTLALRVE